MHKRLRHINFEGAIIQHFHLPVKFLDIPYYKWFHKWHCYIQVPVTLNWGVLFDALKLHLLWLYRINQIGFSPNKAVTTCETNLVVSSSWYGHYLCKSVKCTCIISYSSIDANQSVVKKISRMKSWMIYDKLTMKTMKIIPFMHIRTVPHCLSKQQLTKPPY